MATSKTIHESYEQRAEPMWGWMLALGIATCLFGLFAVYMGFISTVVSVLTLGVLVFAAGLAEIYFAFTGGRWSEFFLHAFLAVLYVAAGVMMIMNPVASAAALTLFLAFFWITGGAFRIVAAATARREGRGWYLINGLLTLALGAIVLYYWPVSSLTMIGIVVGIDLFFLGVALVSTAMVTRKALSGVPRDRLATGSV